MNYISTEGSCLVLLQNKLYNFFWWSIEQIENLLSCMLTEYITMQSSSTRNKGTLQFQKKKKRSNKDKFTNFRNKFMVQFSKKTISLLEIDSNTSFIGQTFNGVLRFIIPYTLLRPTNRKPHFWNSRKIQNEVIQIKIFIITTVLKLIYSSKTHRIH